VCGTESIWLIWLWVCLAVLVSDALWSSWGGRGHLEHDLGEPGGFAQALDACPRWGLLRLVLGAWCR
jgi:hypothetical protein